MPIPFGKCYFAAWWIAKDARSEKLLWLFAVYLLILLLFACIHYLLHRSNPHHYYFATDIRTSQEQRFRSREVASIDSLNVQLQALQELAKEFGESRFDNAGGNDRHSSFALNSTHFRFELSRIRGPHRRTIGLWLHIRESGGKLVGVRKTGLSRSMTYSELIQPNIGMMKYLADHLQEHVQHEIAEHQARQKDGRVWSFLDFIYFSGISLTTVGFGDILPNTTRARMLVLVEVVLGVLLLGFLVNIAVGC